MAYLVKKFSQIRDYEDWMFANGRKIEHADTVVYGCHIVITYKVDTEEALKSAPARTAISPPVEAPLPAPPTVPQVTPPVIPAGRGVIQSRALINKG